MTTRMRYEKAAPGVLKAMLGMETYLSTSSLEKSLKFLVVLRVSQINHCSYCIAMHTHELRQIGESNERIDMLGAWREAPYYTNRERVALAWAEAVTDLAPNFVPDDVYNAAAAEFSERELADLTLAIAAINAWNRFGVAFRMKPENYQERLTAGRVESR